nr:spidroin-1-like [Aegilops tauschii subsp. strangulata]
MDKSRASSSEALSGSTAEAGRSADLAYEAMLREKLEVEHSMREQVAVDREAWAAGPAWLQQEERDWAASTAQVAGMDPWEAAASGSSVAEVAPPRPNPPRRSMGPARGAGHGAGSGFGAAGRGRGRGGRLSLAQGANRAGVASGHGCRAQHRSCSAGEAAREGGGQGGLGAVSGGAALATEGVAAVGCGRRSAARPREGPGGRGRSWRSAWPGTRSPAATRDAGGEQGRGGAATADQGAATAGQRGDAREHGPGSIRNGERWPRSTPGRGGISDRLRAEL